MRKIILKIQIRNIIKNKIKVVTIGKSVDATTVGEIGAGALISLNTQGIRVYGP
jgi:predicted Fe-Mo cluster-binding NifX family protein